MPLYKYESVDEFGKHTTATIEATNIERAKAILQGQKILVTRISDASVLNTEIDLGRVKVKDLALFCQQMLSIIKAGVSTIDALSMTQSTTQNKKLKKVLLVVIEKVEQGQSLSTALREYPDVFPPVMIQMIKAGEESGKLDEIFERLSTQFEKSYKMNNQIKSALAYPKMIILVVILAIVVVCAKIVPMFVDIFDSIGSELPITTKFFIFLSDLFTSKWYVMLGIVIVGFAVWLLISHSEKGIRFLDKMKLKIPLVRDLVIKTASANFARTLSTLLSAGMDYPSSLEIVKDTMDNVFYLEGVADIKHSVENGFNLTDALKKTELFPELLENLLNVGENTGNVEEMLENSANYFEDEVQTATAQLAAALNPVIMIFLGVFVGMLVYSIYSPMFSMYSNMK